MARFAAACLLLALGACGGGGSDDEGGGTPPPPPATGIGPAGGTVLGPNGAKVEIPPGALATNIEIKVELTAAGAPALPTGFSAVGQMFAFTPHGTTFAVPVTMTLPFDPASAPAGTTPALYKTNAQNQWEEVPGATFGAGSVSAQVTSFSDVTVVKPLESVRLVRSWSFREYRGDALEEVELDADVQAEGNLQELFEFGDAFFDSALLDPDGTILEPDGTAIGNIHSSAGGGTYWVGAEAPLGNAGLPNDPIGSMARLIQYQTFIKNTPDASYEFTLTQAFLEVWDGNGILDRPCPPVHSLPRHPCDLIKAEIFLDVKAYTIGSNTPQSVFFRTSGGATVNGAALAKMIGEWRIFPWASSGTALWTIDDFNIVPGDFQGSFGHILVNLSGPRTYTVDLSSVAVGEAFTVKVDTYAHTYNRAAAAVSGEGAEFETAASAWLRDPATIGGTTVTTTGLTPIDTPLPLVDPVEAPVTPAACVPGPGPDPAAGVLQFDAAGYSLAESNITPGITVTRTGGSSGAATATFTTSDGTAVGDVDYTPVNVSVFFADGDAVPRVVAVPIIQDLISAEPDKTVNLTLSQPGGCVALGTQTTAVLTIVDDDPVPPPPSGLDITFGTAGKATSTAFGGDRSAMALQPDGKIVMVGGTFADFILARFNADGSLDSGFGSGGKVTTNMVSGEQEEALGVAIQPDGKIVVVGYTGQAVGPSVFALARYNADGSLDESFGSLGKVISSVVGRAFAVALQPVGPDLRIVVAGDALPTEDIALARFDANGSLDASFGDGGRLTTDVAGAGDIATNIVLQPNGAILVSGGSSVGLDQTSLARYDSNGSLDASFGAGGTLTLSGQRVGEGLALQSDSKIVLVGNDGDGVDTLFATTRLNADGSPDSDFGDAGTVSTDISGLGDAALAVTMQGDGKIVVAGRGSTQTNPNFAVARYNSDGTLDTSFVNAGTLTIDFFGFSDVAESAAVQPDGKIVLGGLARDNVDGYGVARVVP